MSEQAPIEANQSGHNSEKKILQEGNVSENFEDLMDKPLPKNGFPPQHFIDMNPDKDFSQADGKKLPENSDAVGNGSFGDGSGLVPNESRVKVDPVPNVQLHEPTISDKFVGTLSEDERKQYITKEPIFFQGPPAE